jgi:hypothetical protein
MLRLPRRRPSHPTVVSYLALFLALGGTGAYAANTVFSTDIVDGEVKTADLQPGGVTSYRIANGTVGANDLAPDAVTSPDVENFTLTGVDIASASIPALKLIPNSLGQSQLNTNAVGPDELAADAVRSSEIANGAVNEVDVQPGVLGRGWLAYDDDTLTLDGTGQPQPKPFVDVISHVLPPGSYLLSGRVQAEVFPTPTALTCELVAAPASDTAEVNATDVGSSLVSKNRFTLSMMTAWTFTSSVTATIRCRPPGGYVVTLGQRKLMAIRTGVLTVVPK